MDKPVNSQPLTELSDSPRSAENRLFDMVSQQFNAPVKWLDAGEPVSLSEAERASQLGLEIVAFTTETTYEERSFDVITFFNLAACVENPVQALKEAQKLLKENGILILTSSDPKEDPTLGGSHRPPSFWTHLLKQLGLKPVIRFGENERFFEILASQQSNSELERISRSFLAMRSVMNNRLQCSGDGLQAVTRTPGLMNQLQDGSRFYFLNETGEPLRIRIRLRMQEARHPDLFLSDLKLHYAAAEKEGGEYIHSWREATLPPGGINLTTRIEGGAAALLRMDVEASPISKELFLRQLPFDHYQRYRLAADILNGIHRDRCLLLDVGGALGHIGLFASRHEVLQLDVSWDDVSNARKYNGSEFPFPNASFDAVTCIDTLEHIPPEARSGFLTELARTARKTVVLCGPFDEPDVSDAEDAVRGFTELRLGLKDRFLDEHAEYSLPSRKETREWFERHGFSVFEIPNGYLPRWMMMQMAGFALGTSPELAEARAKMNSVYNQSYYPLDNREPAYRYAMVATRSPLSQSEKDRLDALRSGNGAETGGLNLSPLLIALSAYGLVQEKETYISEEARRIEKLLEHLKNLEKQSADENEHRKKITNHTENLAELLKQQEERFRSLETHSANLTALLQEREKNVSELSAHARNLEEQIRSLAQHSQNLESMLREKDQHIENITRHAENLAAMQQGKDDHAQNLLQHAENLAAQHRSAEERATALSVENCIADWFFTTFLPRYHQNDLQDSELDSLLHTLTEQVNAQESDVFMRHIENMRSVCKALLAERGEYNRIQQQMVSVKSSMGYKIFSNAGVIPVIDESERS